MGLNARSAFELTVRLRARLTQHGSKAFPSTGSVSISLSLVSKFCGYHTCHLRCQYMHAALSPFSSVNHKSRSSPFCPGTRLLAHPALELVALGLFFFFFLNLPIPTLPLCWTDLSAVSVAPPWMGYSLGIMASPDHKNASSWLCSRLGKEKDLGRCLSLRVTVGTSIPAIPYNTSTAALAAPWRWAP